MDGEHKLVVRPKKVTVISDEVHEHYKGMMTDTTDKSEWTVDTKFYAVKIISVSGLTISNDEEETIEDKVEEGSKKPDEPELKGSEEGEGITNKAEDGDISEKKELILKQEEVAKKEIKGDEITNKKEGPKPLNRAKIMENLDAYNETRDTDEKVTYRKKDTLDTLQKLWGGLNKE